MPNWEYPQEPMASFLNPYSVASKHLAVKRLAAGRLRKLQLNRNQLEKISQLSQRSQTSVIYPTCSACSLRAKL